MYLISVEGYENANVHYLTHKKMQNLHKYERC